MDCAVHHPVPMHLGPDPLHSSDQVRGFVVIGWEPLT